jgi:hypothetical protein
LWEWTVKIMLGWRGRLDFHRKGNVDTCRARLIRWRFEEEETANLQLIQSSPDLLLNFKLHPFSNLNHVLVYKSHLTCALLWVTCFFFFKKNYICRFFLCIFLYKFFLNVKWKFHAYINSDKLRIMCVNKRDKILMIIKNKIEKIKR